MVFLWNLIGSKTPHVSVTLPSILAVLNNIVVWMVSSRPQTSKSCITLNNHLVTVTKARIKICIIVTFMFYSFR